MGVRLSRTDKLKFIKRNKSAADRAFKEDGEYDREDKFQKRFITKIRETFGYSPNTTDKDIYYSYLSLYNREVSAFL